MVKTAVVILNWNGIVWLEKFLRKTVMLTADSNTIVYVADNGSSDGSVEWISANAPDVRIIRLGKNHGFAGGYNLALGQIDSKYYVLLNSDVEVTENWLHPMIGFLDNNPDVASCQPKIKSYHERDKFEYAGAAGGFMDKYGYTFCRGRIFSNVESDKGQYDDITDIFWSSGACMAVRAEYWEKCGGFDDDFFAHMEEVDLCWRFQKEGFRISYIPASEVYHVGGGVLPYDSGLKTYLNFRNNLFMLYKNLPDKEFRYTLFIRMLLDGVAATFFLCQGKFRNFWAVLKAHRAFYLSSGKLRIKRNLIKGSGGNDNLNTILNKSIILLFYLRKRKEYKDLI
ncbi:MAG: glycosyltransferase family 2 protein [Bacteroidales bacterium]|nr:glycosyltransferase family 2 protein [Bacteroidales bacterium]